MCQAVSKVIFPDAKDRDTAYSHVGILALIESHAKSDPTIQRLSQPRIAVPVVSIELNHNTVLREVSVHYKLVINAVLSVKVDMKVFQKRIAHRFHGCSSAELQLAIHSQQLLTTLRVQISALQRAVSYIDPRRRPTKGTFTHPTAIGNLISALPYIRALPRTESRHPRSPIGNVESRSADGTFNCSATASSSAGADSTTPSLVDVSSTVSLFSANFAHKYATFRNAATLRGAELLGEIHLRDVERTTADEAILHTSIPPPRMWYAYADFTKSAPPGAEIMGKDVRRFPVERFSTSMTTEGRHGIT